MKNKKYTYAECFALLHSRPDCSWKELRKKYKSLIQKLHPDRTNQASNNVNQATLKVVEINIAYQQLEQYYKKEGRLPDGGYTKNQSHIHSSMYKKSVRTNNTTSNYGAGAKVHSSLYSEVKPAASINPKNRTKSLLFLAGVFYIGFILFTPSSSKIQPYEKNSTTHATSLVAEHLQNDSEAKFSHTRSTAPEEKVRYFTYGSKIGDVVSAQGPPDNIKDNVWYYGTSEVHFYGGVVTRWVRTPDFPLYARITSASKKADKKNK